MTEQSPKDKMQGCSIVGDQGSDFQKKKKTINGRWKGEAGQENAF